MKKHANLYYIFLEDMLRRILPKEKCDAARQQLLKQINLKAQSESPPPKKE